MVSHGVKRQQLISTEIATEKDKVLRQRQLDYTTLLLCVTLEESEKKTENIAENFCKKVIEQKAMATT